MLAEQHGLGLLGIDDDGDDDSRALCRRRRCCGETPALGGKAGSGRGRDIEAGDGEAGAHQGLRHAEAHGAQPDDGDRRAPILLAGFLLVPAHL